MVSANPRVLAAVITCVPATPCNGTDDNDTMNGSNQIDQMNGLGGKDRMSGNAGADNMKGGDGVDNINGGDGADSIDELLDTANNVISGGGDGDTIKGGNADDTINGNDGDDFLYGYGGNDRIRGGIGHDILQGLAANDRLEGGDGSDVLVGDWDTGPISFYGADNLKAGPGDDLLFQSAVSTEGPITVITPDGFKDTLDCGDGNDEAWGNVNTDHDEFRNCEVVHRG
jgi:Ca2+-binding RTX toxin-like protein